MERICYTLAIRQVTCQNGIPRNVDNVYTNVEDNLVIPLSFGYSIKILSRTNREIIIQIFNINFIPDLTFNIPSNRYKIFDLPKESGTIRIYIGAIQIACDPSNSCCPNPCQIRR